MTDSSCPYCQAPLTKKPTRKTKCPACGEDIRVFRTPEKEVILVTADQLNKYEQERQEQYRAAGHARDLAEILRAGGLQESEFQEEKQALEAKSSRSLSRQDEINLALEKAKFNAVMQFKTGAHANFYGLAILCARHKRPYRNMLELAAQQELLDLQRNGAATVKISTCGDKSCPACQQLSNKVYPIDQVIKEGILPHPDCTHTLYNEQPGFCRCVYMAEKIDLEALFMQHSEPNLKVCGYCGKESDVDAFVCKHCGQSFSAKFTPVEHHAKESNGLMLLMILIILAIIACVVVYSIGNGR